MAVSFNLPDPYEAQKAEIARRQKYAEALQQQAFQPTEQFSYQGIPAPIPATATLAKILAGVGGGLMQAQGAQEARELREADIKKGQEFAAALGGAKTPEDRQALAMRAMGGEFGQRAQIIGGGEYQMAETRAEKERGRVVRAEEQQANREARAFEAEQNRALREQLAAVQQGMAAELGRSRLYIMREAEAGRTERAAQAQEQKAAADAAKLPPNVVTTYQGAAQNERQAGSTAENMLRHVKDIEEGKLPLGALTNIGARARNVLGMSTPESVRFADLMRDVDGAVNTILQAAKGTQTEGDARRAREQILANPNDPEVVKKALSDLAKASRESQNIYRGTMNQLGGRYTGLEHERLPLLGAPGAPGAPAQRPAAPQAPGAQATPTPGEVRDGYRFRGGDPSVQANWERL